MTIPNLSDLDEPTKRAFESLLAQWAVQPGLVVADGVTAPQPHTGQATIYVDVADGDLKVKFGNGFVRTIGADS